VRRRLAWERALCGPDARTRLLFLTERQRAEFQAAYGTPAERLHVLPLNLDDGPLATRAEGRAALAPLGVSDEHVVLLFVGSDFRRKGLDRVLDALPGLGERARLVVIGEDDPAPFARRARRRGCAARVAFAGARADTSACYARADLLVHPARKETAGIVLLEALRHGVPVVATDVCGFAEHVAASAGGIVLRSPFDRQLFLAALRRLVDDAGERSRLGELGRAHARRPELHGRHERIRAHIEEHARERGL
jgi:UDP-glucose:(heptosyl)LPS alpha-1,3-glucosyltransferase